MDFSKQEETATQSLNNLTDNTIRSSDSFDNSSRRVESTPMQEQQVRSSNKRNLNEDINGGLLKKPKQEFLVFDVPPISVAPIRTVMAPQQSFPASQVSGGGSAVATEHNQLVFPVNRGRRQFWKAGDYDEELHATDFNLPDDGPMDPLRVHPKFLHSNATSHKWALGAFAELLDNALDETINGATYVNVDVQQNKKDGSMMLLVEDNGGGMSPYKLRQCLSLGYSDKGKMPNTIGQYGNGFKTSTMRLGEDVIVFSRCQTQGNDGIISQTQSIGLLSFTFLKGREDIVIPMIDYIKRGQVWDRIIRSSENDWETKLNIILKWSPFLGEDDLLQQLDFLNDQGTRIVIYNLWDNDEEGLELDFDADPYDIQIRGVNRDEKIIQMAEQFPSSRHYLTYKHSLRAYASILYLKVPPNFRIILRGKDVEHHDLSKDIMIPTNIHYKPKDLDKVATGIMGFVKDAKHHIDIQGFNVYHKNRLIKPFWRVWNAAGSDGRGVIGILEANFVEPAHDKQGFESTSVLSKLEAKLVTIQKNYWSSNCEKIGYAARRKKNAKSADTSASRTNQASSYKEEKPSSPSDDWNEQGPTTPKIRTSPLPNAVHSRTGHATNDDRMKRSSGSEKGIHDLQGPRLKRVDVETVESMQKKLEHEKQKCQRLENQLQERTKELEESKAKADEVYKENIKIIDVLQEEKEIWSAKEKKMMQQLRNVVQAMEQLKGTVKQLQSTRECRCCKIEKSSD